MQKLMFCDLTSGEQVLSCGKLASGNNLVKAERVFWGWPTREKETNGKAAFPKQGNSPNSSVFPL